MATNTNPTTSEEAQSQPTPATPEFIRKRARKRNVLIFGISGVLCIVILGLIWSQLTTPAASQSQAASGNASGGNVTINDTSSPLVGKPAPDFTLPALNGSAKQIHLAALKGKPVVLNFWASWCGPCNDEAPIFSKAVPKMQAQGIQFIGVDGPEDTSFAHSFMQKYHISYPNVQDNPSNATSVAYGVTGFPETVFIDKNGMVVAKYPLPYTSEQTLMNELARLKQ
ncbi:MAG TPA: TlpA disulfide reductase family protein [Ktedonobacteraceae bacterium]|jgi:cytochrome c biogenesis protein CcmG/thiol:disulfide interchange protein DsbE|nr:TlpA disulfide reductase family protein [Ktedonobacteraceae bacterium]